MKIKPTGLPGLRQDRHRMLTDPVVAYKFARLQNLCAVRGPDPFLFPAHG